jgi:hypothetical protein
LTISSPSHGSLLQGSVTIEGTSSDANGITEVDINPDQGANYVAVTGTTSWSYNFDTTSVADGSLIISVIAVDASGLTRIVNVAVIVDNTAPLVTITSHADGETVLGTIGFAGTASDAVDVARVTVRAGTGIPQDATGTTSWSINIDTTAGDTPDGGNDFEVTAFDSAGNFTQTSINLKVDQTPPVITIDSPAADSYHKGDGISFDGSVTNLTGGDTLKVIIGGGPLEDPSDVWDGTNWDHTIDPVTDVISDGLLTATVRATDATTNASDEQSVLFYVDNTDPTGTIDWPVTGAEVSGTVLVSGTVSDNIKLATVSPVVVTIDNTGVSSPINPAVTIVNDQWSASWVVADPGGETYFIDVVITDEATNTFAPASVTGLIYNNLAPSGNITSPAVGDYISGSPVVVIDTSGSPVAVTSVDVKVDSGGTYASATDMGGDIWNYTLNTTSFSDGVHDIFARMNTDTETKINVNFDNTAPAVAITNPTDLDVGDDFLFGTVTATGTASDTNLDTVVLYYDASPYGGGVGAGDTLVATTGTTSWTGDWDTAAAPGALISTRLTATATDLAGNSADYTVIVDVKPKIVSIDQSSVIVDAATPPTLTITGYNFNSALDNFAVVFPLDDGSDFVFDIATYPGEYPSVTSTEIQVDVPFDDGGIPKDVVSGDIYVQEGTAIVDSNTIHLDIWEQIVMIEDPPGDDIGRGDEQAMLVGGSDIIQAIRDDKSMAFAVYNTGTVTDEVINLGGGGDQKGLHPSIAYGSTFIHMAYLRKLTGNVSLRYARRGMSPLDVELLSSGVTESNTSIAGRDTDKVGITYQDSSDLSLRYIESSSFPFPGDTWDAPQIVDSGGNLGLYSSLEYDTDGTPCIVYYDFTSFKSKFAYYDSGESLWQVRLVESSQYEGEHPALAIDAGELHISYYDGSSGDLKYAYAASRTGSFTTETVASEGITGLFTDITYDSNDYPHISFIDYYNQLGYAYKDATGWNIAVPPGTTITVNAATTSIGIGDGDYTYIGFTDGLPKVLIYRR